MSFLDCPIKQIYYHMGRTCSNSGRRGPTVGKSEKIFCEVLWSNEGIKICRIITLVGVEHIRIAFLLKIMELNAYFKF